MRRLVLGGRGAARRRSLQGTLRSSPEEQRHAARTVDRSLSRTFSRTGGSPPLRALAPGLPGSLFRRARRTTPGRRVRCDRRQPTLGHGPRRQRRGERPCRPKSRGTPVYRVRSRGRRVPHRKPIARQPISALCRACVTAGTSRRPHRSGVAVGGRDGHGVGATATASLRESGCRFRYRPGQPRRNLSHSSQPAVCPVDRHGWPTDARHRVPLRGDPDRGSPHAGPPACSTGGHASAARQVVRQRRPRDS